MTKTVTQCIIWCLLLAPLAAASPNPQFWGGEEPVRLLNDVPQNVIAGMENQGMSDFFIVLTEQADISSASKFRSNEDRGTYVFNQLRTVAERTQPELINDLELHGANIQRYHIQNMILVRDGSPDKLLAAVNHRMVASIRENRPYKHENPQPEAYESNEETRGIEWNIQHVRMPEVWAEGFTGQGIVVGILDTGVHWTHPALQNQYRGWDGSSGDHDYNWHDVSSSPSSVPYDSGSHGTHCLGTIVGDDGGSNQIGGAPGAKWMACAPLIDDAGFHECFEWFLAPYRFGENPSQGVPAMAPHVVNNSWGWPIGGGDYQYAPDLDALRAAGVFMEFSAGNEGSGCQSLRTPGDYPQVITTGSSTSSDSISSFSSRGPAHPNIPGAPDFIKPEIVAPGSDIRSSVPGGYDGGWNGTSMAGPHTCAAVALLWSAAPGLIGDVDATLQIIIDSAYKTSGGAGYHNQTCGGINAGNTSPNHVWGWGLLDAYAAFEMLAGVYLDKAYYQLDDTMTISVRDSQASGSVVVQVQSNVEPSWEFVTLNEVTSGQFEGTFNTTSGPPVPGDGAISVEHGSVITAWYADLDMATTATADGLPPVISSVTITNVTDEAFTVTWNTNEPADSVVYYGSSMPPTQTVSKSTMTENHQVMVSGLNSGTEYFIMIESADYAGNIGQDDNSGQYYRAVTLFNLWDQPLSASSPSRRANQVFPSSQYNGYTCHLADDFMNTEPWLIENIFVPGEMYNGGTSLANATTLHWRIYADNGGLPAGYPGGGAAPFWSLDLPTNDPQVTLLTGHLNQLSDTSLTLADPFELPEGTWWLMFYPTMSFSSGGQYGRLSSDTTNLEKGKWINPGGEFGYGTSWTDWDNVSEVTHYDIAFRISGSLPLAPTPTPAPPTPTPPPVCLNHGDVNFDGVITASDAQMAFMIALGIYSPTFEEECAADCTGDGVVTAGDAQMIFFAGLGQDECVDPL
jgi:subtilisin family serine protease